MLMHHDHDNDNDHDTVQEVGPEVMSTAPVLGVGEASLGVDQGLATFLMVLVACSLDHQVSSCDIISGQ